MKKSVMSAGASSEMSGASRWLAARAGGATAATDRTASPRVALRRVRDKTDVPQGFPGSTVTSLLGARRVRAYALYGHRGFLDALYEKAIPAGCRLPA